MMWTRQQRRSQWQDGGRYETWLCPSCGRTVEARRPGRRAEALGLYRLKSVEELLRLCNRQNGHHGSLP
jgi:hypothetical protein